MAEPHDDFRAEYLYLQGVHEDYDKRALSLKGLATPLLGAGLAVGLKDGSNGLLIATIAVAIALWILETIWKTFQYCHTDRLIHLEAIFDGKRQGQEGPPFQIFGSWGSVWRRHYRSPLSWPRIMVQPFVALPYVVIVIFGLVAVSA